MSDGYVMVNKQSNAEKMLQKLKDCNKQIKKECLKALSSVRLDKIPVRSEDKVEITVLYKWLSDKNEKGEGLNSDGWHFSWNRRDAELNNVALPLVLNDKFFPNCRRLPFVKSFLEDFSKKYFIHMAGISVLMPGTRIYPHRDVAGPSNGMLTVNYCIKSTGLNTLTIAGEEYVHKEGQYIIFDSCNEHDAANLSKEDRIVLFLAYVTTEKKE